jgi:hypothetical protein
MPSLFLYLVDADALMNEPRPLLKEVESWFEKTGLPLELATAAAFTKAGFTVEHSSVYADPRSEKSRELDVIAHTRDSMGMIQIYGVVECKSSKNPWIVLVDRRLEAGVTYASLGVISENVKDMLSAEMLFARHDLGWRLKSLLSGGYSLRQAFCKDNDPAYAAAMSATNAATALLTKTQYATPRLCFAFPMIVVDAPIFECHLDDEGALQFRQVVATEFLFTAYVPERTAAMIRIVSAEALPQFSGMFFRLADTIKVALKPHVSKLIASRFSDPKSE